MFLDMLFCASLFALKLCGMQLSFLRIISSVYPRDVCVLVYTL